MCSRPLKNSFHTSKPPFCGLICCRCHMGLRRTTGLPLLIWICLTLSTRMGTPYLTKLHASILSKILLKSMLLNTFRFQEHIIMATPHIIFLAMLIFSILFITIMIWNLISSQPSSSKAFQVPYTSSLASRSRRSQCDKQIIFLNIIDWLIETWFDFRITMLSPGRQ